MKTAAIAGALALGTLCLMMGGHKEGKPAQRVQAADETRVSLRGEVVDLACFMSHEGKGKEHVKCAKMCLMDGMPAGLLLDDGSTVLLVEDHARKGPYNGLLDMAGTSVSIDGRDVTRGGLRALIVEKVREEG